MFNLLLDAAANTQGGGFLGSLGIWGTLGYIVIFGVFIYFVIIRPQKKEQKKMQGMLASMEVGDSVVTTSGFYGVIIDISEEDVIVEFGSNKNCRIPMKKTAIAQIEKAE
ncbi:MAG: preprotein translocase subunit YajC [Lachnospiraceae bacterium]|jgi:preprotein translocase subunit YajC|nr:preprotein translocase subunit YajC [Lachnospiraceae bacterium]